jgi:hypothetical protein
MIAWIGTITSIAGSFLVAMQFYKIGYCLFLIGSLCWLFVAMVKRDRALALLNFTFFIANIVGIYNAFLNWTF